jgi:signal transduction histidine kinase
MNNWANALTGSRVERTPHHAEVLSEGPASRQYFLPGVSRNGRSDEAVNAMEELATLKVRFLAVLNHEIRTPLSGIMGMTDLLLETKLDEEQKEYVSAARSCAETLFEVLNATLEYSALSSGRVRL